ncbi:Lrp/AsnC family transcriptional regulator [Calidithermus chliarophilus]|uniref:Lrp/AsnC family transcriptional regulator n=1 Tax=Calidithermus chliarophilus TaxID=52023 RepID=UPI001FDFDB20|nr:AsnC family transcriptional regulator [Calidithermus chliarophilus]
MNQEKLLDAKSWQLLRELQEDARLTYAELARRVGLSVPSVVERVRRRTRGSSAATTPGSTSRPWGCPSRRWCG